MEIEYILFVAGSFLACIFGLMKWSLSQFEARLDDKFVVADLKLTDKFAKVDKLISDVQRVEVESLKRHADYIGLFVARTEYLDSQRQNNRVVNRIFKLLQELTTTVQSKVDKGS